MTCSVCGFENLGDSRFCEGCGAAVAQHCPACGAEITAAARFCRRCGARLEGDHGDPSPAPATPGSDADAGERRHVTVLFSDLVGSTEIAARLDPEEWRDLVTRYQRAAAAAVSRYGGSVAKYLGDGLLAIFGYPRAFGDDAERAVRAGLAITGSVRQLVADDTANDSLRVRVGMHTGPVVVDQSTASPDVFGDTPNIAARVQAVAEPDTVFITAATHRLVAGLFVVEEIGPRELKGVAGVTTLFRVLQAAGVRSRLEATPGERLTPFVGREVERRTLFDRWESARDGDGQVVLVIGEAGIGKSRLVRTLRENMTGQPHIWIECAGSPYFANTPFHALTEMLRQALAWKLEVTQDEMVRRLEQSFEVAGLDPAQALPLLAPLLDLAVPDRYPPLLVTPEARRKKLLSTLTAWLFGLARLQPIVVVVEDLHWVDPSTLELQSLFVSQGAHSPVLFIYTARPEFRPAWPLRAHHTQITLNRLGHKHARAMIEQLAAQSGLLNDVVTQMIARADGVPLFVEELTKAVLEVGTDAATKGIPETLHGSLMARLDRMGAAKDVAQTAAVLGREFSYALLRAISPLNDAALEEVLAALADAELIHVQGLVPEARFFFKHALVAEAAYESLLKSRRRELHRLVAATLRDRFPDLAESQPEVLAHHWGAAGEVELAVTAWQRAGEQALERQAFGETVVYLRRGIALLQSLPDSDPSGARELSLQMRLGQALLVSKGYAAPEAEVPFARARQLTRSAADPQQVVLVLVGLWTSAVTRGEFSAAAALADELLVIAQRVALRAGLALAHVVQGTTRYHLGELAAAREHLSAAVANYDRNDHAGGQLDPGVHAYCYSTWCCWQLGRADEAAGWITRALEHSRRIDRPYESAFARFFASVHSIFTRDAERARHEAEALIALGTEQDFPLFLGWGDSVRGWALAHSGNPEEGTAVARRGLARLLETGERLGNSFFFVCVAESCLRAGDTAQAAAVIDDALAGSSDLEIYDAELHRVRGDLCARSGDQAGAHASYEKALAIARRQGAAFYELRASLGLARLLRTPAAADQLACLCAKFDEGRDTADLRDAEATLRELGATVPQT